LSVVRATVEAMTTMQCPVCQDERVVEQPPCADEHADCPEWLCTDCGAALLIGVIQPDAARRRSTHSAA
jgi:transposase-like protein